MANKVSQELIRVDTLIPSQLLDDAEELREFIKKYYEYMSLTDEQSTNNQPSYLINELLDFRDLDESIDEFIELIRKELGQGVSSQLFANKANLYKFAKEIYSSKGSIESFKLIFRLLFNKEIEFQLPKEQILIASDGEWKQDISIFVNVSEGNAETLTGKIIHLQNPSGNISTFEVLFVKKIIATENIYELFISKNFNATIEVGAVVTDSGVVGTIVAALNDGIVSQKGKNFRLGQIFNITTDFGSGASIKVTGVDSEGGITNFEFLSFGVGYETDFYSTLAPNQNIITDTNNYIFNYNGVDAFTGTLTDSIGGFKDAGFISSQDYFAEDYVPDAYAGEIVATFENDFRYDPNEEQLEESDSAIFLFSIGALCEYSGYFKSNKGFLSDAIYLQDNFFYQNYSYVITVDEPYENYINVLNKSVHPAGMIAFGQFDIINNIDISENIVDVYGSYEVPTIDFVSLTDSDKTYVMDKSILNTDLAYAFDYFAEDYVVYPSPEPSDAVELSDQIVINNGTEFLEMASIEDAGNVFVNAYSIDYFEQDYTDTSIPARTF